MHLVKKRLATLKQQELEQGCSIADEPLNLCICLNTHTSERFTSA